MIYIQLNNTTFVQGKLRIGLAEQTVLASLAHAVYLEKDADLQGGDLAKGLEVANQAVKKAFSTSPSYDKVRISLCFP